MRYFDPSNSIHFFALDPVRKVQHIGERTYHEIEGDGSTRAAKDRSPFACEVGETLYEFVLYHDREPTKDEVFAIWHDHLGAPRDAS